jgi:hypothetical protein
MAVSTTFKPTTFAALFDVEDPQKVFTALDTTGVKVVAKSTAFDVVGPNDENIVMNIGLNAGVIGIAQSGNLPSIAKAPVAAAIKSAFNHALKSDAWSKIVKVDDDGDIQLSTNDIDGMETPVFSDKPVAPKQKATVEIGDAHADIVDGSTMPKVKLADAVALYQPVSSTSQGSTYICVALAGDLKFAARRKDQSLSIRVEGPVGAAKTALIAAGFNEEYISKGYTSVHFHNLDDIMAQRALGAVLMGTGLQFSTPLPNLSKVGGE